MKLRRTILTLAATFAALAAPASASACTTAGISVAVAIKPPAEVPAGGDQSYSYTVSYCTRPDRITTQIVKVINPRAYYMEDPSNYTVMTPEAAHGTSMTGAGVWTTPANNPGVYAVLVRYYAQGAAHYENIGTRAFIVAAPAPAPPTPTEPSDPAPPPPVVCADGSTLPAGSTCPPPVVCADGSTLPAGSTCPPPVAPPAPIVVSPPPPAPLPPVVCVDGSTMPAGSTCPAQPQGTTAPVKTRLAITKRANRRIVQAGNTLRYTIRVRNAGSVVARMVRTCDKLPRHLTFVSARGARWVNGSVCWTRRSLAVGQTATYVLIVKVDRTARSGRIVNVATARASNAALVRARAIVRIKSRPRPTFTGGVTG